MADSKTELSDTVSPGTAAVPDSLEALQNLVDELGGTGKIAVSDREDGLTVTGIRAPTDALPLILTYADQGTRAVGVKLDKRIRGKVNKTQLKEWLGRYGFHPINGDERSSDFGADMVRDARGADRSVVVPSEEP